MRQEGLGRRWSTQGRFAVVRKDPPYDRLPDSRTPPGCRPIQALEQCAPCHSSPGPSSFGSRDHRRINQRQDNSIEQGAAGAHH